MLTLGISTSSSRFGIIISKGEEILTNSDELEEIETNNLKEIHAVFTLCMSKIEYDIQNIENIIVDNGPGGTSSVRTGVAYANALAYSLGIGVRSISSFELLGLDLWLKNNKPIILTTKSIKGNAFVGFYENNSLKSISYGKTEEIVNNLVNNIDDFIVTGFYGPLIKDLYPEKKVCLSDKIHGDLETFIEISKKDVSQFLKFPKLVIPITENYLSH
jgi:tRNA A37 threonylcarbamoyladenosine modification protein TsaB